MFLYCFLSMLLFILLVPCEHLVFNDEGLGQTPDPFYALEPACLGIGETSALGTASLCPVPLACKQVPVLEDLPSV